MGDFGVVKDEVESFSSHFLNFRWSNLRLGAMTTGAPMEIMAAISLSSKRTRCKKMYFLYMIRQD